jgi:hypothetical protein
MQELRTAGHLVEYAALEGKGSFAAVLARTELEAALHADGSVGLWFELGHGGAGAEDTSRLTLEVTSADVERMLQSSPGDEIVVALDAEEVDGLLADSDVEAHGIRGALAIAVATAAIAAPTSLAATPQVSSEVSPQVSSQVSTEVSPQVSGLVATTQVSRQVLRPASTAQVRAQVVRNQLHRSLVLNAAGVKVLRSGLAG